MQRDLRIDFLKGVALIMILVNHLGYFVTPAIFSYLTSQYYGFSDAAELFVFLSGYLIGIVFLKFYKNEGKQKLFIKAGHRAFQLYLWIVFTSLIVYAVYGLASNQFNFKFYEDFYSINAVFVAPERSLAKLVLLLDSAPYVAILRYYIMMLLYAAVLLPLLNRSIWITFVFSALLYIISFWVLFPNKYFDFFSWQFLFVISMIIGIKVNHIQGKKINQIRNEKFLYLAFSFIIVSLFIRLYFHFNDPSDLTFGYFIEYLYQKYPLSIFRIIHCVSLLYIIQYYFKKDSKWLENPVGNALITLGQNSLEVYSFGSFFALVSYIPQIKYNFNFSFYVLSVIFGLILSLLFGSIMKWYKLKPWLKNLNS